MNNIYQWDYDLRTHINHSLHSIVQALSVERISQKYSELAFKYSDEGIYKIATTLHYKTILMWKYSAKPFSE